MTAAEIAAALKARRVKGGWLAKCPAHADRTPSLSISEGKNGAPVVFCHAKCPQEAVIDALRRADLWGGTAGELTEEQREEIRRREIEHEREARQRQARAWEIWHDGGAIAGTPAEVYLRSRGIIRDDWPETLRWSDDASTEPDGRLRPALVAAVNDGRTHLCVGVHRIFLRPDGTPLLRADGSKVKLALGPVKGNAVELSAWPSEDGRWGLAEGVEDALAGEQLFGMPVWSAVNAGNMADVRLPSWATDCIIFADADDNGTGMRAATAAMEKFRTLPHVQRVRIFMADSLGCKDVADILRGGRHAA